MRESEQLLIRNQERAQWARRILVEMEISPGGTDWINRSSAVRWLQRFEEHNNEAIDSCWEPT